MAPNPRRLDARLDALYAELPHIECKGFCSDSCGPIQMSVRERERIERDHGEVSCGFGASCTMLDGERRCRAYDVRPMICRLWGLMEAMRCHYGCKPERYLTDVEAARFLARSLELGGAPSDMQGKILDSLEKQAALMGEEAFAAYVKRVARKIVAQPALSDRARLISPPGIANNRTGVDP